MNGKLHLWALVLVLGVWVVTACGTATPEPTTGLANPASVYCEEQGYTLEMQTDADSGTYGVCKFPDGSECEEWAFYRGDCKPASLSEVSSEAAPTAEPPTAEPTETPEPIPTEASAWMRDVAYEGISFTFDRTIATDVAAEIIPTTDEQGPPMEPTNVRFAFDGYVLPDTFHQPRVLLYPMAELEAMSEHTARTVADLRQLLLDRPAHPQAIPFLPLFHAGQMMRTQVAYLDFQNGTGVRFLTQYAQAYLPINNHELFYTFQGLTDDGSTYVAAILPVSHPALPADHAAYDGDLDALVQNFDPYIAGVEEELDAQAASSYTPDLSLLDAMIRSLEVVPDWTTLMPPAAEEAEDPYPDWETYVNTDYEFSFHYPTAWTLEEEANLVKLSRGTLLLAIAFQREGEEIPPPWTGMPAGNFKSRGTLVFLGQEIDKNALVYEDKVKVLTYGADVGDLVFSIRLDDTATADYEAIEIPADVQSEVDRIVGSFEAPSAEDGSSSVAVEGTVMDVSLSARVIMLQEPVEGFDAIALTEESEVISMEGARVALRDIPPGMRIEASGELGQSHALLARQVRLLEPIPTSGILDPPEPVLKAALDVPATLPGGEAVPLRFTLTNLTDTSLYVLKWYTPLEGIAGEIFRVERDGEVIPYAGILATRAAPTRDNYVSLAPGESASAEVDLATAYDFSRAGRYTIKFVAPRISDVARTEAELARTLDDLHPVQIVSNPVIVEITGSD